MKTNYSYHRGEAMTVVVIILVVALIGALSFIAWQNFVKKDEPAKGTETVVKQEETAKPEEKPAEEAYRGERVSSIDGLVSFKAPNGWVVHRMKDYPSQLVAPMLGEGEAPAYDASKKPKVSIVEGGAPHTNFLLEIRGKDDIYNHEDGAKSDFTLDDGTKGNRVAYTSGCPRCIDSSEMNWNYLVYTFQKDGRFVQLLWASTDNQEAFIDKVARTIEFK